MTSSGLSGFGVVDYIVFSVMLIGSLGIGVYYGIKGNKTTEEFLLAGRSLSPVPVAMSLIATYISSISILGEGELDVVKLCHYVIVDLNSTFRYKYGEALDACT